MLMFNKTGNEPREPLIRIARRNATKKQSLMITLCSLGVALLILLAFILIVGKGNINLLDALKQMWEGTFGKFGNKKSMTIKLWDTSIFAAKLLCIAVALTPAFKMKFWNIGAEGQVIMGGLVIAFFMHSQSALLNNPFTYILVILLATAAGALWGVIPAFFKAQWGTNETLFTLMMNYIAMKIMDYFYNDWKGLSAGLPSFDQSTWLPAVFGENAGINVIVFVALAILMYFYLAKTKHGYEIAVVGESPNTARYAGINVKKVILRTMILSGALCGLCGALTVAGQVHSIAYSGEAVHTVTNGYGFTAIIVSWLAGFNTLGMILISVLIMFLQKGTGQLGNKYAAFSTGAGNVMIGIVLFCIIGGAFFKNYRVIFRKRKSALKDGGEEGKANA